MEHLLKVLEHCNYNVKTAVIMIKYNTDRTNAEKMLEKANGVLKKVFLEN